MTATLRAALYSIPADDREAWVAVGMAIHAELDDAGFDVWDAWSRQAKSYKAADAKSVWRGFKRNGGIQIGTLYHIAKEHGWQGEAPVIPELSPEEKCRREQQAAKERELARRRAEQAAQLASKMLSEAELLPHQYLARKGFSDVAGLVVAKDNLLLVPMRSIHTGKVQTLQTITADGRKRFLPGGKAKGAVYNLGRHWTRWYVEGYATGLSVQAALRRMYRDDQVVVCFSAANLAHVATPTERGPRPRYVITDNDENGTGEKYAKKTGHPYWLPPEPGDANDYHQAHGLETLAEGIREVLSDGRREEG